LRKAASPLSARIGYSALRPLRLRYPYRRVEDAYYAHKVMPRQECNGIGGTIIGCTTLDAFEAKIAASSERPEGTASAMGFFSQSSAAAALPRLAFNPIPIAAGR